MISLYVSVDLDEIYSELDAYDKEKIIKMLYNDGYLNKHGYTENYIDDVSNEKYLNRWQDSIHKLSKVKQHFVSNEDEEIIAKLAKKYYL